MATCQSLLCTVVKSSWLPVKSAAYLGSIGRLLCLAFLCGWRFLNKISLDWLLTLTTQLSISKRSDNPASMAAKFSWVLFVFAWMSFCLRAEILFQIIIIPVTSITSSSASESTCHPSLHNQPLSLFSSLSAKIWNTFTYMSHELKWFHCHNVCIFFLPL